MKKVFYSLLVLLLLLPLTVKADMVFINTFFNSEVSVDERIVVNTILNFDYYPHTLEYSYDQSMLSITKEDISTPGSSDEIKIENGKVSIVVYETGAIEEYGQGYVTLKFKAIKAGTTEIEPILGPGYSSLPGKLNITISDKVFDSKDDSNVPTNTEKEKSECKNDNTLLYISLGANVVLVGTTIILLINNKKKTNSI